MGFFVRLFAGQTGFRVGLILVGRGDFFRLGATVGAAVVTVGADVITADGSV